MNKKKEPSFVDSLPTKGVYTLLIFLKKKGRLEIRGLGSFTFQKGYYTYTGSAVGEGSVGLRERVARHLRKNKIKHWHIDFLLANENAEVAGVVAARSRINKECQVNKAIKNVKGVAIPVAGFGASDCRQNCRSHLAQFDSRDALARIVEAYSGFFEKEKVHVITKREKNCKSL